MKKLSPLQFCIYLLIITIYSCTPAQKNETENTSGQVLDNASGVINSFGSKVWTTPGEDGDKIWRDKNHSPQTEDLNDEELKDQDIKGPRY